MSLSGNDSGTMKLRKDAQDRKAAREKKAAEALEIQQLTEAIATLKAEVKDLKVGEDDDLIKQYEDKIAEKQTRLDSLKAPAAPAAADTSADKSVLANDGNTSDASSHDGTKDVTGAETSADSNVQTNGSSTGDAPALEAPKEETKSDGSASAGDQTSSAETAAADNSPSADGSSAVVASTNSNAEESVSANDTASDSADGSDDKEVQIANLKAEIQVLQTTIEGIKILDDLDADTIAMTIAPEQKKIATLQAEIDKLSGTAVAAATGGDDTTAASAVPEVVVTTPVVPSEAVADGGDTTAKTDTSGDSEAVVAPVAAAASVDETTKAVLPADSANDISAAPADNGTTDTTNASTAPALSTAASTNNDGQAVSSAPASSTDGDATKVDSTSTASALTAARQAAHKKVDDKAAIEHAAVDISDFDTLMKLYGLDVTNAVTASDPEGSFGFGDAVGGDGTTADALTATTP